MARRPPNKMAAALSQRFRTALQHAGRILLGKARDLPTLPGLSQKCQFTQPQENVLTAATDLLVNSRRVFRYGSSMCCELDDGDSKRLVKLAADGCVEKIGPSVLANLFVCTSDSAGQDSPPIQFAPPSCLIELLASRSPTIEGLPEIKAYSTRPLFDAQYSYRDAGWHPDVGYLIHSGRIEPVMPRSLGEHLQDNIPPRLKQMLEGFSLKSEIDLVNAVGVLVTGLLVGIFVDQSKALVLLDGNQPAVGKTLFARVIGTLLDDAEPVIIPFTSDDVELEKKLCAGLRSRHTSAILIDNAKLQNRGAIESVTLEANSVAPLVSLRILGRSENYTRPNDLLWFVTMNDTRISPDLMSRGIPIRFHFDGDPATRQFSIDDPIQFAKKHREEILGELIGMVMQWTQLGRPEAICHHRLRFWATTINSILVANGLGGFLNNMSEASASFNTELDAIAALVETAMRTDQSMVILRSDGEVSTPPGNAGKTASELVQLFLKAGVNTAALEGSTSHRGRATVVGNYLSRSIGRQVSIEDRGRQGTATLRVIPGRSNSKTYYFDVSFGNASERVGGLGDYAHHEDAIPPVLSTPPVVETSSNAAHRASACNNEQW